MELLEKILIENLLNVNYYDKMKPRGVYEKNNGVLASFITTNICIS